LGILEKNRILTSRWSGLADAKTPLLKESPASYPSALASWALDSSEALAMARAFHLPVTRPGGEHQKKRASIAARPSSFVGFQRLGPRRRPAGRRTRAAGQG